MRENGPDYAKRSNSPWVFVAVLVFCTIIVVVGIWLAAMGTFAGWSFIVTGLLFGSVSTYWLRRFAKERRNDQGPPS
jgi:cyanate permease